MDVPPLLSVFFFFFFNDTATTEIYTLSLHDALPILRGCCSGVGRGCHHKTGANGDRKSTRLNSSHQIISYAVFCLKKKKTTKQKNKKSTHRPTRMNTRRPTPPT